MSARSHRDVRAHRLDLAFRVAFALALASAGLAGCRFGGPTANPDEYVPSPSDGSVPEEGSAMGDDATVVMPRDATGGVGPTGDDDAAGLGDDDGDDDGGGEGEGGCGPTVATCDPVLDTGCNPFQQCDVDTSQTTHPTGICVFNSGTEGGTSCMATLITESCPAHSTCVAGACRALCFCNAECPAGQCCTDTSGPAGFTLCQTCP